MNYYIISSTFNLITPIVSKDFTTSSSRISKCTAKGLVDRRDLVVDIKAKATVTSGKNL